MPSREQRDTRRATASLSATSAGVPEPELEARAQRERQLASAVAVHRGHAAGKPRVRRAAPRRATARRRSSGRGPAGRELARPCVTQIRGSSGCRAAVDRPRSRGRARRRERVASPGARRRPGAPARRRTRACAERRGRTSTAATVGQRARPRARAASRSSCEQARPARARERPRAPGARPPARRPSTSIVRDGEDDVSRAASQASARRRAIAKASRSERPEGTSRPRSRRSPGSRRGNGTTTLAARARGRDPRSSSSPAATASDFAAARVRSYRGAGAARRHAIAEEHDLVLELDAELLARTAARLGHQREAVGGRRAAGVLDEVRVLRRDHGAADPVALEPAELEHPPRAELAWRVLEDASRTCACSSAASPCAARRARRPPP